MVVSVPLETPGSGRWGVVGGADECVRVAVGLKRALPLGGAGAVRGPAPGCVHPWAPTELAGFSNLPPALGAAARAVPAGAALRANPRPGIPLRPPSRWGTGNRRAGQQDGAGGAPRSRPQGLEQEGSISLPPRDGGISPAQSAQLPGAAERSCAPRCSRAPTAVLQLRRFRSLFIFRGDAEEQPRRGSAAQPRSRVLLPERAGAAPAPSSVPQRGSGPPPQPSPAPAGRCASHGGRQGALWARGAERARSAAQPGPGGAEDPRFGSSAAATRSRSTPAPAPQSRFLGPFSLRERSRSRFRRDARSRGGFCAGVGLGGEVPGMLWGVLRVRGAEERLQLRGICAGS